MGGRHARGVLDVLLHGGQEVGRQKLQGTSREGQEQVDRQRSGPPPITIVFRGVPSASAPLSPSGVPPPRTCSVGNCTLPFMAPMLLMATKKALRRSLSATFSCKRNAHVVGRQHGAVALHPGTFEPQ